MTMWGIHNDELSEELLSQGFISIGWEIGDLSIIGDDPDRIKELLAADSPGAKPRAVASWAGTVRRFAFDMVVGGIVIFPGKADRTLSRTPPPRKRSGMKKRAIPCPRRSRSRRTPMTSSPGRCSRT